MVYLSVWIPARNVLTGGEWITSPLRRGSGAELSRMIVSSSALVVSSASSPTTSRAWASSPASFSLDLSATPTASSSWRSRRYRAHGRDDQRRPHRRGPVVIMAICSADHASSPWPRWRPSDRCDRPAAGQPLLRLCQARPRLAGAARRAPRDNVAWTGYSIFAIFFIAISLQGILVSIAGPAPNYDMQRILAAKTPRESALMSASSRPPSSPRCG